MLKTLHYTLISLLLFTAACAGDSGQLSDLADGAVVGDLQQVEILDADLLDASPDTLDLRIGDVADSSRLEVDADPGAADQSIDSSDVEVVRPQILPSATGCNGWDALCSKRYDEVAYATTHNAMSTKDEKWYGPNQLYKLTTQLEDGVRAMMLDLHRFDENVYLCHTNCSWGKRPLVDALVEINTFLTQYPREVLTIIFENYVGASELKAVFEQAGLSSRLHTQPTDQPWPTLQQLIDKKTTLVVFTDSGSGDPAWLHDVWSYAWETHWSNKLPADFSCARNRGTAGNSLFILNHFLTNPIAAPNLAKMVNFNPLLIDRARQCQTESGRLPNFVTVDFYSIGDLFETVNLLNGVVQKED